MAVSDADWGELFGADLSSFVKTRKAIVKRLKQAGDLEGAEAVAAIRKPSLPLWAINQLVAQERDLVERLLRSLDEQGDLQLGAIDDALDVEALGQAREQERAATRGLARAAERVLSDAGQAASKSNLDRITKALRDAALVGAAREALLAGRLVEQPSARGFEAAAEQIDPALLLSALSAQKATPNKRSRRRGDDLFARSVRRNREPASGAKAGSDVSDVGREAAAEHEREREEAQRRAARIGEAKAKLAVLHEEREQRKSAVEMATRRVDELQGELDLARAQARKAKRQLADHDERIRRLERRME